MWKIYFNIYSRFGKSHTCSTWIVITVTSGRQRFYRETVKQLVDGKLVVLWFGIFTSRLLFCPSLDSAVWWLRLLTAWQRKEMSPPRWPSLWFDSQSKLLLRETIILCLIYWRAVGKGLLKHQFKCWKYTYCYFLSSHITEELQIWHLTEWTSSSSPHCWVSITDKTWLTHLPLFQPMHGCIGTGLYWEDWQEIPVCFYLRITSVFFHLSTFSHVFVSSFEIGLKEHKLQCHHWACELCQCLSTKSTCFCHWRAQK